jgi:hypothetical protein
VIENLSQIPTSFRRRVLPHNILANGRAAEHRTHILSNFVPMNKEDNQIWKVEVFKL